MMQLQKCSSCGSEIEPDVTFGQCPKCLLELARFQIPEGADPGWPLNGDPDRGPALPDYEILERIGRGGMGTVYRARQRSLDRVVAIKVLSAGDLATPAMIARFRREAEAAAKLDHPNIVPIYEVGEYEANPFLVMKFAQGASLSDRLPEFALAAAAVSSAREREERRGKQVLIARLIALLARAIHYAHGRGVLHRDLKPSNILIDDEQHPHLTDFGIAKFVGQETALTQTAELLGTPGYMSPEQAAGRLPSPATDIYGLGIVLFELLTGRRPFEGDRPVEVLRQVVEEEPTHPQSLNPSIDGELAIICLKCMDKDPSRRYPSALALAEDLERWQRHEPILARPVGRIRRLRRWTVRNPALATLIGALVVGIILTLALLAQTQAEKDRKSIALAILRTEAARQLQEIWALPSDFFTMKSETLSAMAGKEPAALQHPEERFTIAFVAEGNPLGRVLGVAPVIEYLEEDMTRSAHARTRFDLRLYKNENRAMAGLVAGEFDFMQLNARQYLHAKGQASTIQPLVSLAPSPGPDSLHGRSVVVFTRGDSGIKTISDLRGRSFLFSTPDSTLTFWAKVCLVEGGLRAKDLTAIRYLEETQPAPGTATSLGLAPASPALGNPFSEMTPVAAVVDRHYDAAVASERRFLQVAEREKLLLLKRFPDAGALLVASAKVSSQAAAIFQQAILNLKDPQILQAFPGCPTGFERCTDKDFAGMESKLTEETLFDETSPEKP